MFTILLCTELLNPIRQPCSYSSQNRTRQTLSVYVQVSDVIPIKGKKKNKAWGNIDWGVCRTRFCSHLPLVQHWLGKGTVFAAMYTWHYCFLEIFFQTSRFKPEELSIKRQLIFIADFHWMKKNSFIYLFHWCFTPYPRIFNWYDSDTLIGRVGWVGSFCKFIIIYEQTFIIFLHYNFVK